MNIQTLSHFLNHCIRFKAHFNGFAFELEAVLTCFLGLLYRGIVAPQW